ncbi:MAG TPA: amidohydrolase family protein [Longimicrobiales bacterium]|nr:amidohydrolase family protein [Longimicrobiales bacterium]
MRPTLYAADWLMPVSSEPVRDGAVLVDGNGVIREAGPRSGISSGDDVAVVELGRAILLPGLVNVHAHPELAGMRGLLEDLPFHQWIPALRRAKEGASAESGDFAAAARWTCAEAIAGGVTTMCATEDSGASLYAMREAGLRGIVYREVFGPSPAQAQRALQDLIQKVESMRQAATDLVHVGVSPHAPYTVSDDLFRLVAAYAVAESLPMAVHIAESEAESQLVVDGDGPFAAGLRTRGIDTPPRAPSPIALLHQTGVLAARPLLIHCVRIDADDITRIADAGAVIAHCPVANARLGHGISPIVELAAANVTIALGSDSVASSNRIDMLEEARVTQLMQRARLRSAGTLDAAALLRMLTLDGARALGLDSRTGSLEPGKDADLCAVRIGAPHTEPVHDPAAALLFSARGSDVALTVVRGQLLYRDGRFVTVDVERLRDRFLHGAERMRAALDER